MHPCRTLLAGGNGVGHITTEKGKINSYPVLEVILYSYWINFFSFENYGRTPQGVPFYLWNYHTFSMKMLTVEEYLRYPTSSSSLVIIIFSFVSVLKKNCTVTFQAPLRYGTYFDRQTHHHSKFYSLDIFLFENQILYSHYCTQTDRLYHKTQLHSLNI